jgi:hypothetical protein
MEHLGKGVASQSLHKTIPGRLKSEHLVPSRDAMKVGPIDSSGGSVAIGARTCRASGVRPRRSRLEPPTSCRSCTRFTSASMNGSLAETIGGEVRRSRRRPFLVGIRMTLLFAVALSTWPRPPCAIGTVIGTM